MGVYFVIWGIFCLPALAVVARSHRRWIREATIEGADQVARARKWFAATIVSLVALFLTAFWFFSAGPIRLALCAVIVLGALLLKSIFGESVLLPEPSEDTPIQPPSDPRDTKEQR
jgi:hypothetical protein